MSDPSTRVEVEKLAHELAVDAGRLDFLTTLPASAVRDLRADLAEALFARHEARFRRLAKLSHLAPLPITAKVVEIAFSPLLGARVAAVMDPEHAARLAGRLDPLFLTDLSVRLDPARAEPIIRGLPETLVVDVGRRLLDREEYLALGRFVSVVDVDTAVAVVAEASPAEMLQVGLFTEDVAALDAVMGAMSDERLVDVLAAGLSNERYDDLATLLTAVSPASRQRLLGLLDDREARPLHDRLGVD